MYLSGFGNYHQSEAIAGALPDNQNSPQKCPYGLYAEQLSGTAFTKPRDKNQYSWLYRKKPSAPFQNFSLYNKKFLSAPIELQPPIPMRWSPFKAPKRKQDFIDGQLNVAQNETQNIYLFQATQSMNHRYYSSYDGELLIVIYEGRVTLQTEFGMLTIEPGWIAVIPRGVRFKVELLGESASGYLCENLAEPLKLPNLGPIGANGLANPRHFLYPKAAFEDIEGPVEVVCKYQNNLWSTQADSSPLDVVAWHGNYAPYSYDLSLFMTVNTVSFDHPDPSIFTVLTSESHTPGVANLDFVIFPSRWMVAEHTFRPPYFHRNIMSEFMGLIKGQYDAKQSGFEVGGFSIHNCMTGHGPDFDTFEKASQQQLKPDYYENTLAFMFESCAPWLVTEAAQKHKAYQKEYLSCWSGLKSQFSPDLK